MELIEKCGRAILASIVGLSLFAADTSSAKTIVIQSSGPSASRYPAGRVLSEPLSIDLRKGDSVKILDSAGTRVLTGPGKIRDAVPRTMANEKRVALANLMSAKAQRRSRTGAVRKVELTETVASPLDGVSGSADLSANPETTSQNDLWVIDPLKAGSWCVQNMDAVELWRADNKDSENLTVTRDSGAREDARWPKGGNIIYWPANIPANDAERYFIQVGNGDGSYITLHDVGETDDMVELATALEANHCDTQFDMLLADVQ
jgi:hypothetical protein